MKENGKNGGDSHTRQEQVWQILHTVQEPSDRFEDRIISQVTGVTSSRQSEVAGNQPDFSWIYKAAAVLLLAIGVALWYFLTPETRVEKLAIEDLIQGSEITYIAASGETRDVRLSAHIHVQLNTETELRVLNHPSQTDPERTPRLVYLKGEAYFNVKSADEGFEVVTDAGIIRVVGTSFNVRARGNRVEVSVESGTVALRGLPDETNVEEVQIPQGFMSRKERQLPAIHPLPVDLHRVLSWRGERIVFEQTPLTDVIEDLNRTYNVLIVLRDKDLERIRVTGEFGREPLTQILNEICWSANIRYQQEEDRFVLYQPD